MHKIRIQFNTYGTNIDVKGIMHKVVVYNVDQRSTATKLLKLCTNTSSSLYQINECSIAWDSAVSGFHPALVFFAVFTESY